MMIKDFWSLSSGPTLMEGLAISNKFAIIGIGPLQSIGHERLCKQQEF